ncbi:MFS general substrate transporter [Daedalea quercina L-15889]|uniref:MFS general substrate transporter n=1 Tax=Daedalea quercina L-15889 TaxID=1314783 RepID=A0A165P1Q1_9APHY|nr:MFS general substrate transporter [Daedalea quercina L-15889]
MTEVEVVATTSDERALDQPPRPWGLKWRSSVWFITAVVGLGVATDLLVYSLIVPIIPFQLEDLGYSGVSGLVGWLLFAYSAGVVIFTPPVAHFSEKYNNRQIPLVGGLIAILGAQIMFMLAPAYWLMIIARLLQGLSSTVIWVAGLALLCDTVPESSVGRQLGFAMSGLSIGFLVGPPVSGALYDKFGFHGPFIFGIIVTTVDLTGRFLVIERKHALRWGLDPAAPPKMDTGAEAADSETMQNSGEEQDIPNPASVSEQQKMEKENFRTAETQTQPVDPEAPIAQVLQVRLSLLTVLARLMKSVRAEAVFACTLLYGWILASQEPALPLHLQAVWNFDPSKVGLVYIAAVVPTLFSSTVTGYLVDKWGTGPITVVSLAFSLPWILILIVQSSLPLFIVMFALSNFGVTGTVSPLTAELASVTRQLSGVGYAHVYGAFNIAYGIGSALGPIIGGQARLDGHLYLRRRVGAPSNDSSHDFLRRRYFTGMSPEENEKPFQGCVWVSGYR